MTFKMYKRFNIMFLNKSILFIITGGGNMPRFFLKVLPYLKKFFQTKNS